MHHAAAIFLLPLMLASVAKSALPEPPNQHKPWTPTPSEAIPDYVQWAAEILFDSGLADPRGCAYRQVEIPGFDDRFRHLTSRTHAWVFSTQYAVAWDGLVYRVRNVGARADLDRDVRHIAASDVWRAEVLLLRERKPPAAFWSNLETVRSITPISIALLLRLCRPDLAAKLWHPARVHGRFDAADEANQEAAWLKGATAAWLGTAFVGVTELREAKDDRDAADLAESVLEFESRLKSRLMNEPPQLIASIDRSFLAPLPALLADSQRRLREPGRAKLDLQSIADGKSTPATRAFLARPQAERIADLIDRLEDVQGAKMGWPGPLIFSLDPIAELLVKEGEAAVEPLLDASEQDKRLTRTVDFGRPWYPERKPIPVSEVAQRILCEILRSSVTVGGSSPQKLIVWW